MIGFILNKVSKTRLSFSLFDDASSPRDFAFRFSKGTVICDSDSCFNDFGLIHVFGDFVELTVSRSSFAWNISFGSNFVRLPYVFN